jgi:hypothetical protein
MPPRSIQRHTASPSLQEWRAGARASSDFYGFSCSGEGARGILARVRDGDHARESEIIFVHQCRSVSSSRDRNYLGKQDALLSERRIIHAHIYAMGVDSRKIEFEFELGLLALKALLAPKFGAEALK